MQCGQQRSGVRGWLSVARHSDAREERWPRHRSQPDLCRRVHAMCAELVTRPHVDQAMPHVCSVLRAAADPDACGSRDRTALECRRPGNKRSSRW